MTRSSLTSAILVALFAGSQLAAGQKPKDEPRRPKFPAGVDTNSAQVYYDFGLEHLERDPDQAADAFYWAARINPTSADAYYARRCALLLADRYRFQKYMIDDRRTLESDDVKRIDSLYLYALTINPFLYRKLDVRLFHAYVANISEDYARHNSDVSPGEVQFYLERQLSQWPASFRAGQAYGEGRFDAALSLYAEAIRQARFKAYYRVDRGRIFFQLDHPDSALSELTLALEELRKTDKKELVYVYDSKAVLEHSIGLVQQRLGNAVAAKEAFGRALEEDLSYFPAHIQMGYIALEAKDTTTALSEMDLAVQIRGDDPSLRYIYGYALASSGKFKDAEGQLRKAIELDPVFATPYFVLGQVLDGEGKGSDALTQYQAFLARASKQDLRRKDAEDRVRELAAKGDR
ncbi:MAG TPA: tetratricopeptide repeat protein [Gemmatimonadaceae bacterium]|jgi:tetratricopeptide (TPR) repeat protein